MTSMKLRLTGDRLECKWWPALSSRPTTQDQLAGKISGPQSGEAQPHTLVRAQLAQAGANLVEKHTIYIESNATSPDANCAQYWGAVSSLQNAPAKCGVVCTEQARRNVAAATFDGLTNIESQ
jgi:hypothetical protein